MEKEMTSGEIDDVTKIDIDDSNDPLLSNLRIALESWQEWSAPTYVWRCEEC